MQKEILTQGLLELPNGAGTLWLRDFSKVAPREANLGLMDSSGAAKWHAAEVQTLDKWVDVRLEGGRLFAGSFAGFVCELSLDDGTILSTKFAK